MTLLLSSVRLAPTLHRVHRLQDKQIFEIYVAVALDGTVGCKVGGGVVEWKKC